MKKNNRKINGKTARKLIGLGSVGTCSGLFAAALIGSEVQSIIEVPNATVSAPSTFPIQSTTTLQALHSVPFEGRNTLFAVSQYCLQARKSSNGRSTLGNTPCCSLPVRAAIIFRREVVCHSDRKVDCRRTRSNQRCEDQDLPDLSMESRRADLQAEDAELYAGSEQDGAHDARCIDPNQE